MRTGRARAADETQNFSPMRLSDVKPVAQLVSMLRDGLRSPPSAKHEARQGFLFWPLIFCQFHRSDKTFLKTSEGCRLLNALHRPLSGPDLIEVSL